MPECPAEMFTIWSSHRAKRKRWRKVSGCIKQIRNFICIFVTKGLFIWSHILEMSSKLPGENTSLPLKALPKAHSLCSSSFVLFFFFVLPPHFYSFISQTIKAKIRADKEEVSVWNRQYKLSWPEVLLPRCQSINQPRQKTDAGGGLDMAKYDMDVAHRAEFFHFFTWSERMGKEHLASSSMDLKCIHTWERQILTPLGSPHKSS